MSINHFAITVPVAKFDSTVSFYLSTLQPLGVKEIMRPLDGLVGLGTRWPTFWIAREGAGSPENECEKERTGASTTGFIHLCFSGKNKKQVQDFHAAAIKAGAQDRGKPGLRPQYTSFYYAAFVTDPLGNNLEVMTCDFDKYWNYAYSAVGAAALAVVGGLWGTGRLGI